MQNPRRRHRFSQHVRNTVFKCTHLASCSANAVGLTHLSRVVSQLSMAPYEFADFVQILKYIRNFLRRNNEKRETVEKKLLLQTYSLGRFLCVVLAIEY